MDSSIDNNAIIFVYIINDFNFDGSDNLLKHTVEIVTGVKKLRQFGKENDVPIIYVNDDYGIWQAYFRIIIDLCQNSRNQLLIQVLKPVDSVYFLIIPQHSAFLQTPFHALLNV